MYDNLMYSQQDGIGTITINRPAQLNALNKATLFELERLLSSAMADESLKVLILTGSGSKAFVAGADIKEMQKLSAMEGRDFARLGQRVLNRLEKFPQPVIAAVNGFALGGGCELAVACDIRIVCESAKFAQPEVSLGILPGFGGTQRLARLIGKGRAKELLFTGDMIDAAEAYRIGLANQIVPQAELLDVAKKLAMKIMSRAPLAVRACKSAINTGLDVDLASGIAYEAEAFGLCFATLDHKEGLSAFIEKRSAHFIGK